MKLRQNSAKSNFSKHPKTSFPHKKSLYQYDSTHRFLHQYINNSTQQSNAEDQMKYIRKYVKTQLFNTSKGRFPNSSSINSATLTDSII